MPVLILGMPFSFLISCYLSKQLNYCIFLKKTKQNLLKETKAGFRISHLKLCFSPAVGVPGPGLKSHGSPRSSVSYEMEYCWFRRAGVLTASSVAQRGC